MEILIFILAWIVLGGIGGWVFGLSEGDGVRYILVGVMFGPLSFALGALNAFTEFCRYLAQIGEEWEESRNK